MMLYLIPGLGADGRLFIPLLTCLPATIQPHVLEWLPPAAIDEPLAAYAARLAAPVPLDIPCWVAGVSFGGMVALEVGRLRPLVRVIQISSLSDARQLRPALRLVRATGLYRLAPPQLLRAVPQIAKWFFGIEDTGMYALLRSFLANMNVDYTRWATQAVFAWRRQDLGSSITIHGTHDRVFPLAGRVVDYQVAGGPHFMVYSHAVEVGAILTRILTASHAS